MVTLEWRPVVNYEGHYEVSSLGHVKSLDRIESMSIGRHSTNWNRKRRGRFKQLRVSQRGYPMVVLFKLGKSKNFLVHRLVAMAFLENPNHLPEVNHIDGNQENNSITNLEWTTRKGNALHSTRVLKKNIGQSNKLSKLSEKDVLTIKELLDLGRSQIEIARKFSVTNHAIHRIAKGKNWAWLTGYGEEDTKYVTS